MKEKENQKVKRKLENLKRKLQECEKLKEEYLAGWQRSRADFLNYKKEESERMKEFQEIVKENFILELLPILDNFEKAEKELSENLKNDEYIKGFLQIRKQLSDFLKKQGVEKIESLGKRFDPHFHEAIEEVETREKESGIVIEEIEPGYKLKEKLLRPAKVKVARNNPKI